MPRIFISYRRADSITITGRIYDHLVAAFGEDNVFKDVDDIPLGADFRQVLDNEVGACDVLLAIIGPSWVTVPDDQGRPRLHDPDDFVHIEINSGLLRPHVLVIPVLVKGAPMPASADLPPALHEIAYRNAAVIRDDPDFSRDMRRLIEQINEFKAGDAPPPRPHPPAPAPEVRQTVLPAAPPPQAKPVRTRSGPPLRAVLITLVLTLVAVVVGLGIIGALSNTGTTPVEQVAPEQFIPEGQQQIDPIQQQGFDPERILSCETEVQGALSRNLASNEWVIEGQEGQRILVTMERANPNDYALTPLLALYHEPDDTPMAEDTDSGMDDNARIYIELPEDGIYTVYAEAVDDLPQNPVEYVLRMSCDREIINCGDYVEGEITNDRVSIPYVIYLEAGTTVEVEMYHSSDDRGLYPDPHLQLLGPNDDDWASDDGGLDARLEYQIEDSGLYTVIATRENADDPLSRGPFGLQVNCR